MEIELKLSKKLFTPKAYPLIFDYSHRFEFWFGGAGSSKSYSITQKLIIRACREQIKILVCRKYATTIRNTVFSLFKDILAKWKLTEYVKIRESDFRISFPNGSEVLFIGLDEETKLLSLNNIGTIWIEEAYEVSKELVEQLNLRMRGQNANQQIIMSWNPISKSSWLYDFVEINPPENYTKIHLVFQDNPFLNKEYKDAMEDLKRRNPRKADIYYYGNWGVDAEGLVFQNFKVEDFDITALTFENRVGLDFGFRDPSAIVASMYDKENKRIYVYDEWYKANQQLDDIYKAVVAMKQHKAKIWCDSAEPRSIEFLRQHNINAVPCIKGPDSVEARIAFLQNHEIIIHPSCENVVREFENFSYIKDKDGNYTDKTTHEFSHSIDALGYSYSDIYRKSNVRVMDKAILGL